MLNLIRRSLDMFVCITVYNRDRLTHEADHSHGHICCQSIRPSPIFKIKQSKQIFNCGRTCGLAKWIIYDYFLFSLGLKMASYVDLISTYIYIYLNTPRK